MPVPPGNYLFPEGNRVAENSSGERNIFNPYLLQGFILTILNKK